MPELYSIDRPDREPVYFSYYELESSLNHADEGRFNVRIGGQISVPTPDNDSLRLTIGQIQAHKLLLSRGHDEGQSGFETFDHYEITYDLGEQIYDFEKEDFTHAMQEHFTWDLSSFELLIITQIEVLPEYRGKQVAARAIKDMIYNYSSPLSLVALTCYPLQFLPSSRDTESLFDQQMNYGAFSQDRASSLLKLRNHFMSMGFENVPGVDDDYLFLDQTKINPAFAGIQWERD